MQFKIIVHKAAQIHVAIFNAVLQKFGEHVNGEEMIVEMSEMVGQ